MADAPDYDLKHIEPDEVNRRIKNIEVSRRARINRCYMNMKNRNPRGYFYNKDYSNDNPNIYQKERILKKPGVILHLDR